MNTSPWVCLPGGGLQELMACLQDRSKQIIDVGFIRVEFHHGHASLEAEVNALNAGDRLEGLG